VMETAATLRNLCHLYFCQNKQKEAKQAYVDARDFQQSIMGPTQGSNSTLISF